MDCAYIIGGSFADWSIIIIILIITCCGVFTCALPLLLPISLLPVFLWTVQRVGQSYNWVRCAIKSDFFFSCGVGLVESSERA